MASFAHKLFKTEKSLTDFIPYSVHVTPECVRTANGDLVTVIKLAGAAHEAADVEDLFMWHRALNGAIKNIAEPELGFWRTTIRMERGQYPGGNFLPGFAHDLNAKYEARMANETMYANDLYFSLVLRGPSALTSFFGSPKRDKKELLEQINDQVFRLDQIANTLLESLSRYVPERLATYEKNGLQFSAALRFFSFLLNQEWCDVPLPRARIAHVLGTSRLTFGTDVMDIRTTTTQQFGAMLAVNEYPEATETGELNMLLTLPFPFVLTQSFACIDKNASQSLITKQRNKLVSVGDASGTQIAALDDLKDNIAANRDTLGDHHLSLLVMADNQKELISRLAKAKDNLSQTGFIVAREDLALEAAYFSQLPGNFSLRPRPAPITSTNFAGLAALHNYPQGKASDNQWGPAVTLINTLSGSPYYFNFHLPIKGKRKSGGQTDDERVPGNTLILGPTGSGKTVIQAFLIAQAEKYKPHVFTFDKDQGQEIFIRAMGGVYSTLKNGQPTGFNPYKLELTPSNINFLTQLTLKLATGNTPLTTRQENEVMQAVLSLKELDAEHRSIATLRQFLDATEEEGPYKRLERWQAGKTYGWALDNSKDTLQFEGTRYFGFDCTDFLDNDIVRTPITMYLLHRMKELLGHGRFILNMDEFWKLLQDPVFEGVAEDLLLTIRKLDGICFFGTQSPRQCLNSKISYSIVDQCVTKLLLPNGNADRKDYIEGFKLTEREFDIVRETMPELKLRGFLLKQTSKDAMGASSTICELNLAGFSDELAVMSGTADSVAVCAKARQQAGENPEQWLPVFHQLRKGR